MASCGRINTEWTELRGDNKTGSTQNKRERAIAERSKARREAAQRHAVAKYNKVLAEDTRLQSRDLRKRADDIADEYAGKAEELRDQADAAARDAERHEHQALLAGAELAKAIAARDAAEVEVLFGFQWDLVKFTGGRAVVRALEHAQAQNPTAELTVNLLIDALLLPDKSRKDELLRICGTHELELSDSVHYKRRPSV